MWKAVSNRPRKSVLTVLLVLLNLSIFLYSRENSVRFDHISLEQGLSQSFVLCIIQDNSGFMWFGTEEGLNKYDGYRFTWYKPEADNPGSLSSNLITSIAKDNLGNLWIGTDNGLNTFNFDTEKFTRYLSVSGQPGSLSHPWVNCIFVDSSGDLWVGTRLGLNKFDRKNKKFSRYISEPRNPGSLSNNDISFIYEDRSGTLWIGTIDGGLNRLDREKGIFVHYLNEPGNPGSLSDNDINSIYEDRSGTLWIGTAGGGLNRLDREKGVFVHYMNEPGNPGSLSHNDIGSIYEDRSGTLWIGTKGGGLNVFHRQKETFTHFRADPRTPYALSHDVVLSIYEDQTNVIWVGSRGGLSKFDRERKQFIHYKSDPDNPNSLANNEVRAIYQDKGGTLWIGLDDGGLDQFDAEGNRFIHHKNDPDNPKSLSFDYVRVICEDSRGEMWIGTDGGGLNKLDRTTDPYTFIHYHVVSGDPQSLSCNRIYSISEDRNGALWIGTYRGGVNRMDPQTNRFVRYLHHPDDPHSLSSNFVRVIYEDTRGILWIGTDGGGVNKFDGKKFTHYRKNPNEPNSLSNDAVFSIYEDSRGILWIGTDGGGLNKFDREKETFIHYNESHGLPNNVIYGILEDERANLWLSSNQGLTCFNPENETFKNYTNNDGLQSREFNANAFFKSRNGQMYFGGINGFNVFYPADIKDNPHVPPVVITDFKIFNRSVLPGEEMNGRIVLSKAVNRTREIRLSYKETVFSLEFAALHYAAPEKNRYLYKMDKIETEWNDNMNRRFVTYANLSPGTYVFRVKGANNDGLWNEEGTSLKIVILPPFWNTLWFRLLILSFGILLIFVFFKYRTYRIRLRNEELEQRIETRTKELVVANQRAEKERLAAEEANKARGIFLARMSHEIRTPMNGVIGFTDILLDTELDEEQLEYVKSINRSSRALLTLLNDILDFSKIEAHQLSLEFVDFDPEVMAFDICDLMKPRIEGKPIEIDCSIGDNVPAYVKGDAGRYRQILINLMGNAVKFTEKGKIEISIDVEEKKQNRIKLHAAVRDTGVGIPENKIHTIFDVFQQADNSITRKYGGTGLGLSISKHLAELMDGDVWTESELGEGSTFHFSAWLEKSRKDTGERKYLVELPGKKVLIVDDNEHNLEVLTHALGGIGMRVHALTRSDNVVSVLQEAFRSKDPFDLCILDIQMPGVSGNEICKEVRALDSQLANIPLLAFSSSSAARARKYREVGFDGFLPKPLQRQKLFQMVEKLLKDKIDTEVNGGERGDRQTVATQYSIKDEAKHSVRILLVEDNVINQKLAMHILTRAGYKPKLAVDGKEAVEMYTSVPGEFDLILMDIQMPVMDGVEAAKRIREWEAGHQSFFVPIIAITAEAMKGDREKCLAAGMNDYMSKPVKREKVYKMVKKWALERKELL